MRYYARIAAIASANGETAAQHRQMAQRLKLASTVSTVGAVALWLAMSSTWAIAPIMLGFILALRVEHSNQVAKRLDIMEHCTNINRSGAMNLL
ncbi:hypothetical protein ACEN2Y_00620 (plasmid) [Ralstonia solanacearum]|uniref:hypothetical protein n=1 Tax=Ralstonia solanacearum TaxID=305 RepID=UPI003216CD6E